MKQSFLKHLGGVNKKPYSLLKIFKILLCGTVTYPESQDWLAEPRIETLVTKTWTLNLEALIQTNKREDHYNMQIRICFSTS